MPIIKCYTEEEIRAVKDYLGSDYLKVPYLYTNLYKYGVGNDNVDVWIDKTSERINGVYLRYFTCLHFFTREDNYSKNSFIEFVKDNNFEVIMLEETFGEKIQSFLQSYTLTREYTIKYDIENSEYSDIVCYAEREEIEEIAELLMNDQIYQEIYTKESLYNQLLERFDAGYGKCSIIKKDGKIVANASINGENDRFAFIGSNIVHPEFRRMGFGTKVLNHLLKYVQSKELECLCYIVDNNFASLELHKNMNALPVGMIYKFRKL
ncbi:MAG: GNAT family N-acetyltransferase [Bacteroidales bacterium]